MWTEAKKPMHRFDLVHATAFPYAWPIACGLRLARRLGVPFLLTPFLHLGDPEDANDRTRNQYTTPALLSLIHAADRVFVQTNLESKELLRHGVEEKKLVLLGMGVEPQECTQGDRESARREWQAKEGEVVVGHLANNSQEKGTIDLLLAADRLWRQGKRLRLVLAGSEMANFRSFWKSWCPAGPVIRLGQIDDQQKRDFFAGIDLFALPKLFGMSRMDCSSPAATWRGWRPLWISSLVTPACGKGSAPAVEIASFASFAGKRS
jgi:glycosyltransferase involved in cell wall biosynthesis